MNFTGQYVTAGQALASIYSPELLSTQEEYLRAKKTAEQFTSSPDPQVRSIGEDLVRSARRRLELFDVPESFNLADWLLDARVREGRGDRVALRLPDRELSYGEVQRLAHRFANVLGGLGVRRGELVFVALPDGAEFVGALFGTREAGAVVVMVNPELASTPRGGGRPATAPR